MAPPGVTIHTARMFITEATPEGLARMTDDVDVATRLLATAEVDVMAFACTSGSLLYGAGYDRRLAERISCLTRAKVVTTSTAVLEAFYALGVRTVAVGTPYIDAINERVAAFLEANGIRVARLRGLGIRGATDIARQPPSVAYRLGSEVDCPEAEAIFLSCTNFRAAEAAEALECDLGKPVVTSNQATMWAALRAAGITDPVPGFGRLLRQ
jgi:maleate cis-trans isomerase